MSGVRSFSLSRGEWIHLDYQNAEAQTWLSKTSGLDPIIIRALQLKEPRPRTHFIDGGILFSLRGVNSNPGAEPDDMVSVRIWIDKKRIITSNHRPVRSIADVERIISNGKIVQTPFDILILICQNIVSYIDDAIDDYEDTLLDLETNIIEKERIADRTELMGLRRELISVRRHLTPQREAFSKLILENLPWVESRKMVQLREVNDHLIRILENIDALRERSVITHEELISRVSDQLNNRIYRLSIISAIFLPLTFLTGLLGINVGGIPGAQNDSAFITFMAFLIGIVILQIVFFKFKKWL